MSAPPSDEALRRHRAACEAGQPGYADPSSGLFVLTSHALRASGACCGQGCRHCPWPPEVQRASGRDPLLPSWPWPSPTPDA